jgi:dTMP kinase
MRSDASRRSPAISFGVAGADVTGSRGRFITVEGGEGVGKSTQVGLLAAALGRAGILVRATREPGGSEGGEAIRRLLLEGERDRWTPASEALLFVAARHDHVTQLIAPALAQGTWVVCDRFADSTLAYQGYAKGMELDQLRALHRFALGDFAPDLTIILDLTVEIGLARATARSAADRFEGLDRDFHSRLRQGFRQIAADDPARCALIDASADPAAVHRAVLGVVEQRLGVKFAAPPSPLSADAGREGSA